MAKPNSHNSFRSEARRSLQGSLFLLVVGLFVASSFNCSADPLFEQLPYQLYLPEEPIRGVVIYLHGMSPDPARSDRQRREALVGGLGPKGWAIAAPTARGFCDYVQPAEPTFRCWADRELHADIDYLSRFVSHVEREHGVVFSQRQLIGFSNGAYFIGTAFRAGLLNSYSRVGMVAGGSPRSNLPLTPANGPEIYVEIALSDLANASWGRQFVKHLRKEGVVRNLHVREVPGIHDYNLERMRSFVDWYETN